MRFQFSFKHMDVSPALKTYTKEKIEGVINKFVTKPIEAAITFSVERHLHTVHCDIFGGDGFSLSVQHSCKDMYGSVDHIVDKLHTQLKRKKDRLKQHKGHSTMKAFNGYDDQDDYDSVEVDAADIIKYETAKRRIG